MRRWLALAVLTMALAGGLFAWSRTPARRAAAFAAAPAAAGQPVGDVPATAPGEALVAPISEVTPAMKEARRFNRYDKDKDGAITRDEYFVARRKAFAKLDLDGDGKLSFDEYSAKAAKKFATADADRDGRLAAAEFATTAVKRRARAAVNCPPAPPTDHEGDSDKEG